MKQDKRNQKSPARRGKDQKTKPELELHPAGKGGPEQHAGGPDHHGGDPREDRNP